jgi:thiol-disulfide isomerase/thioredoxin
MAQAAKNIWEEVMIRRTKAIAPGRWVRAETSRAGLAGLLFILICIVGRAAAGAELELRYYGATWCAPCHQVGPMVDRWVASHPDLHIVKLDYDAHKADRERFGFVGVPMLVLLAGDKIIAKYGQNAQKVGDFAFDRLEWWFESARGKIDAPPQ